MPSTEVPGYNSLRVQKAYRINGIESGRLDKQLQILERQKLHTARLVNNDIRLTRITLDHIEASSGRSIDQQGFLGSDASSSMNSLNFAALESEDKPMFLYGERKVSRRRGKFRRIQSAMVKGRNTSTNAGLAMTELAQRPKSSIPTFREIKDKVKRQIEINPDWDPNIELPYEPKEEEKDKQGKRINAWASEDRLTSAATTTKGERHKSGKRSSVSWHLSKTPPDEGSTTDEPPDVITLIEEENLQHRHGAAKNNKNLKNSGINIHRTKSASAPRKKPNHPKIPEGKIEENNKENGQESTEPNDRKLVKSAKGRLERTSSFPKPKNPRDHPMVKVVGKTRALIGQAKKAQSSTAYIDPETSQLGTIIERQLKKKAEKLQKRKDDQVLENVTTDSRVTDYFSQYPLVKEEQEIDDPVHNYSVVRDLLIERKIPLVSRSEKEQLSEQAP